MLPKPPLHPLSALSILVIDAVFTVAELGASATLVGVLLVPVLMVLSGGLSLAAVAGVERVLARQPWRTVWLRGGLTGLLTALPFFFLGGLTGLGLLLWAGLYAMQKSPPEG